MHKPARQDANVICPYYEGEDAKENIIACEGVNEQSFVIQVFRNRWIFAEQKTERCTCDPRKCRHYRAVNLLKYGEKT